MRHLELYRTEAGREPFSDWLDSLDKIVRAKVKSYIDRVALGGSNKNLKQVGFGVFEIKIEFGPGYRVYFGKLGSEVILLLLGGDKSTQVKDIKMAQIYWRNINVQR